MMPYVRLDLTDGSWSLRFPREEKPEGYAVPERLGEFLEQGLA
jgi:hypothetical protein